MERGRSFRSRARRWGGGVAVALLVAVGGSVLTAAPKGGLALPAAAARAVDFERDVRPIFEKACVECHGAKKQKSDYRLDERESALKGGSIGGAIVPGDGAGSLLVQYVAGTHPEIRMPPKGEGLSAEQVGVLRAWIDLGAKWPDSLAGAATTRASGQVHWAYRPLVKPVVPSGVEGGANPIDAFVRAKLKAAGLRPSAEAGRRALIRRVTFDLIGLPPTPEEVEAFVGDASPGAYERVVDRLLASPRYGERWARHWMDVAHYADTHGNDEDKERPNAWPYRDYLIRSLNADKTYGRFVEEQLAGDALYPDDPDGVVATGFVAAGPWDQSSQMGILDGTIDKQAARYLDRDDMLSTAMSTFVSSTVHCARCHNHKFDPIPQADYYALQAVFAGVDRVDRPYDADARVLAERRRLTTFKEALENRVVPLAKLLAADSQKKVAEWEARHIAAEGRWRTIESVDAISTGGATLRRLDDGSVLARGERPDKDAYVVIGRTGVARVMAIRVEVLADSSLPKNGPGRAENGNLHLSELKAYVDEGGANRPIALRNPTADFDQEGWTVAHAADGKAETAWGVHPQEGKSHAAVFELAEPLEAEGGAKLTFLIDQAHGRGHTIGRFRISVSDAPAPVRAVKLPEAVVAALATPAGSRSDGQRAELARYVLAEETARALGPLPAQQKVYAIASDFAPQGNFKPARTPRVVEILRRGDVRQPMGPAAPGALSCVGGLPSRFELPDSRDEAARREALARWVAARENVLTWRSIVNRVWHYHFGRGIVETPNDFGRMGAAPTHPELLDWLAVTFRDDLGGSLKRLHRLIVTSATYRQASTHDAACAAVDGENALLWRMNRTRLDAESVRDAVLAMSGRLDLTMGGPAQKQFVESKGVHETPNADYDAFDVDSPAARRRSVYHFVFRTVPDPLMRTMDCPDASQLAPRREASVTALQALAMLNDRVIVRQSQHVAGRLAASERDVKRQVRGLYLLALGRPPADDEVEVVAAYAVKHGLANAARVLLNSNEFMFVE